MTPRSNLVLIIGLALLFFGGCDDSEIAPPGGLQTPRSFSVSQGPVCVETREPSPGAVRPAIRRCESGERGAIGLVANQSGDEVSVVDMTRSMRGSPPQNPRLVDLDTSIPGVTGINVGRAPVDVAASNGTTAYALSQANRSLSVINLWVLEALDDTIVFDAAPRKVAVSPAVGDAPARLVVALSNPSRLWVHDAVECDFPEQATDGFVDRQRARPHAGCDELPSQADGESFELPGAVSDLVVGPGGDRAYVAYSDTSYASVIALTPEALDDLGGDCIDGDQQPCEARRVGLTFDCSNGIDDDGDGLVDREDLQCYGPRGAEAPGGIGRNTTGNCANELDDDGDGVIDRDDADCLVSGADEDAPIVEDPVLACSDERDNDGDGAIDYPADAACYGEVGRTERDTQATGFASLSIDPFGAFLYVVDRGQSQVLVVDAKSLELVDAFDAGGRDRTAFSNRLGISVPASPMAIAGRVDRAVVWRNPQVCDSGECRHAVVRYNYGAFVASDDGFAYNVNTMSTYCEVDVEQGPGIVSNSQFFLRSQALEDSPESRCLTRPNLPISYDTEACVELDACLDCRAGGRGDCGAVCENFEQTRQDCFGNRLTSGDDVRLAFNPQFELQDSLALESRLRGLGSCETPSTFAEALRQAADGAADISCTSPLRPQPVAPGTDESELVSREFRRASLLEKSTLRLAAGEQIDAAELAALDESVGPFEVIAQSLVRIHDQAIVDEAWTVTFEGVIPRTNRNDATVSADEPGVVDVAGLDLCNAGVEAGDRLTIRSRPTDANGEVPEQCEAFVDQERGAAFRTWTIEEVRPREVVLSTIDADEADDEQPTFAQQLPTRECFAQGLRVEIRANDEWTVVGDRTGMVSEQTSVLGTCQPRFGAEHPRVSSRVSTGEIFEGPYLSFLLTEGAVEPVRNGEELSYRFSVQRGFRTDRFRTTTLLPTQVVLAERLPGGRFLIIPDASQNFIYIRNLNLGGEQADFLLQ